MTGMYSFLEMFKQKNFLNVVVLQNGGIIIVLLNFYDDAR